MIQLGKGDFQAADENTSTTLIERKRSFVCNQVCRISTNNRFGRAQTITACALCVPNGGRFRSLDSFESRRPLSTALPDGRKSLLGRVEGPRCPQSLDW